MKLSFVAGLAALALGRVVESDDEFTDEEMWTLWKYFQTMEGPSTGGAVSYTTMEEHNTRYNIFKDNMEMARQFNQKGEYSFKMGVTSFADLTEDEFQEYIHKSNGYKPKSKLKRELFIGSGKAAPDTKDWTTEGAVTPIKNQGQCGSCWSFSTTGSIEGQNYLTFNKLSSFSEQELVDCSHGSNQGCNGGDMDAAFEWIETNGLCYESAYPYTGVDGTCEESSCTAQVKVKSYVDIAQGNTDDLKTAVGTVGPISVAVDANTMWQLYTGGIFDHRCNKNKLDHGVLAVGYGSNFWKVKNSWGESWGEDGYIRLADGNTCGIAQDASYPVVEKPGL